MLLNIRINILLKIFTFRLFQCFSLVESIYTLEDRKYTIHRNKRFCLWFRLNWQFKEINFVIEYKQRHKKKKKNFKYLNFFFLALEQQEKFKIPTIWVSSPKGLSKKPNKAIIMLEFERIAFWKHEEEEIKKCSNKKKDRWGRLK